MDPVTLLGPSNSLGYPAPYWFLVLFKVIGFTLHMIFMNIFYVGPMVAMIVYIAGGENGRILSSRIMRQMPIIIAYGVNFGIVPLLFIQVAYYKVFYPATILIAWPWIAIIALLTIAYYGVYIYAIALKENGPGLNKFRKVSGWISAILFLIIGFLFTNGFSLMTNLESWAKIWHSTSVAGAPLGTALNTADPTLWPRWLMVMGLALTTLGSYIVFNTHFFARKEPAEYKKWAMKFALLIYLIGSSWFAITGSWYVFGTWPDDLKSYMMTGSNAILTYLTAIALAIPFILILIASRRKIISTLLIIFVAAAQVVVVALNAISRQLVQNFELGRYLDITAEQVKIQWSPLILFLLLFVGGVVLIIWMIRQAALSSSEKSA